MFEKLVVTSAIGCALLASACSDDVKTVGKNTGPTNPEDNGMSDITGIWDLTASVSETGETTTGTLEIAPDIFRLEIAGVVIDYSGPQQELWVDTGNGGTSYNVTHDGGEIFGQSPEENALDLGVIPADITGGWMATTERVSEDRQLFAFVRQRLATLSSTPGYGDRGDGGALQAERYQWENSVFGDLGGSWNIATGYDITGACSAHVRDTVVSAGCTGTESPANGSVLFTLQEGTGFGSTSDGLEISALRR